MAVILFGIVIVPNLEQPLNAFAAILVVCCGKDTLVRFAQSAKALLLITLSPVRHGSRYLR